MKKIVFYFLVLFGSFSFASENSRGLLDLSEDCMRAICSPLYISLSNRAALGQTCKRLKKAIEDYYPIEKLSLLTLPKGELLKDRKPENALCFLNLPSDILKKLSLEYLPLADRVALALSCKQLTKLLKEETPIQHLDFSLPMVLLGERESKGFVDTWAATLNTNHLIGSFKISGIDTDVESKRICKNFYKYEICKRYSLLIKYIYNLLQKKPNLLENVYSLQLNEWDLLLTGYAVYESNKDYNPYNPAYKESSQPPYVEQSYAKPLQNESIFQLAHIIKSMKNLRFLQFQNNAYPFPFIEELSDKPLKNVNFTNSSVIFEDLLSIGRTSTGIESLTLIKASFFKDIRQWSDIRFQIKKVLDERIPGRLILEISKRVRKNTQGNTPPEMAFQSLRHLAICSEFVTRIAENRVLEFFQSIKSLQILFLNHLNNQSMQEFAQVVKASPESFKNLKALYVSSPVIDKIGPSSLLKVLQQTTLSNGLDLDSFRISTQEVKDDEFYYALNNFLSAQKSLRKVTVMGSFVSRALGTLKMIKYNKPSLEEINIIYPRVFISVFNIPWEVLNKDAREEFYTAMKKIDPSMAVNFYSANYSGISSYLNLRRKH